MHGSSHHEQHCFSLPFHPFRHQGTQLFCYLGLCNQHTLIFFAAPCIISVCVYGWPWVFRPINILLFGLIFFGSLLPYAQWFHIYYMQPKPRYTRGVLSKFARNASSASSAAVLDGD